jgi:5'-3' exonuclease
MIFIFIDGSYFCFYRFFALQTWWKNAHPDTPLEKPHENVDFVAKFRSTFVDNVKGIVKKVKRGLPKDTPFIMYAAKDCPRKQIWRMPLYPEYKSNRDVERSYDIGPFFKLAYEEKLFQAGGCCDVLSYPTLEADDCIAIATRKLPQENQVTIITSDADYLQLASDNVTIMDLRFKPVSVSKKWSGDPKIDLFCKILTGDPSDGIPSAFPKCGMKTALRCYNEEEFMQKQLKKHPDAQANIEKNKKLICFSCIPEKLVTGFLEKYSF